MSGEAPLAPYESLVAVAEQQLERAAAGDQAALDALAVTWQRLVALAPAVPPAQAAAPLGRAAELTARAQARLEALRARTEREIARAARSAHAARGYARQAPRGARVEHRA